MSAQHSTEQRYQSPERPICARLLASYVPRSSEDRSLWMFFIQVVQGRPGGHLQFSAGGLKMAWLASAFSSICARCPKKVRWLNDGWKWRLVGNATDVSISDSRASECPGFFVGTIGPLHQSALLIAQHSDPYSIIGSMKTLYRWSLVLFVIRDLHKCLSRLCIADRVMDIVPTDAMTWRLVLDRTWYLNHRSQQESKHDLQFTDHWSLHWAITSDHHSGMPTAAFDPQSIK